MKTKKNMIKFLKKKNEKKKPKKGGFLLMNQQRTEYEDLEKTIIKLK